MIKYLYIVISFLLISCGDSSNIVTKTNDTNTFELIGSSTIEGVNYTCQNNTNINSYTTSKGIFSYPNDCGTLIFKLGTLELAKIDLRYMPNDNKLYITDLVGVNRDDTNNQKVSNLSRVFQSLDNNLNSHDGIKIDFVRSNNISNLYTKVLKDFNNENDLKSILVDAGISSNNLVSINYALVHLENKLRKDGIYVDTQKPFLPQIDKSNYILQDTNKKLFKEINNTITIASSGADIKIFAEANTYLIVKDKNDTLIIDNKIVPDLVIKHSVSTNNLDIGEYNITSKDNTNKISDILNLNIIKDVNVPRFDLNDTYDYNISKDAPYILDINSTDIDINTTDSDVDGFVIYDVISSNKDIFDINSSGYLMFKNTPVTGDYNITIRITDFARHDLNKTFNIKVLE